jgi:hypothetical protein
MYRRWSLEWERNGLTFQGTCLLRLQPRLVKNESAIERLDEIEAYSFFPALNNLPGSQVPILVGAAAAGIAFFIFTIPLAYWLAVALSRQGISSLERSTQMLRTRHVRVRESRRDADRFTVE